MQENILKTSNVTKIYLDFYDGKNRHIKEEVTVRYMDSKFCYLVGGIPINFNKPKWRAKANIIVYTTDGIYKTTVIIRDINFSLSDVVYRLDLPKKWDFKQLRAGSRKKVALPFKIKFNDDFEINANLHDLSVGGFSFVGNYNLSTVHTRFACNCKITFPKDSVINFPDGILDNDAIFVRKKPLITEFGLTGEEVYCFKFLNLSPDYVLILKNFLMKIE